MRIAFVFALFAILCPAAVLAQTGAAPSTAAPSAAAPSSASAPEAKTPQTRGGNITRDEYIERAKQNAEKRFDRMDTDHDGILTPEERAAAPDKGRAPKSQ